MKQLDGPISARIQALHTIAASKVLLADPRVRQAVVRTLNESTNDPNWEAFEETQEYEDYYDGALFSTVQKIATDYHEPEAWKALISSNYNDGSVFSQWLAAQPEAVPTLFQLAREAHEPSVRSHALYTLAEALERCQAPDKSCEAIGKRRQEILGLLRARVLHDPAVEKLAAVRGLGLCGEKQDIALLGKIPSDDPYPPGDKAFKWFVQQSQQQIESRLKNQ